MELKNKKAYFDYYIEEETEAGIVLVGSEIKSLRQNRGDIKDSYVTFQKNEAYLLNMYIPPYKEANIFNHEERKTRKLLLHKKEIKKLKDKVMQDGYSLVPLKIYLKRGHVKVLIGLVKGKKSYDKRESIKKRDIEREAKMKF